jgi:hypothetical protein
MTSEYPINRFINTNHVYWPPVHMTVFSVDVFKIYTSILIKNVKTIIRNISNNQNMKN